MLRRLHLFSPSGLLVTLAMVLTTFAIAGAESSRPNITIMFDGTNRNEVGKATDPNGLWVIEWAVTFGDQAFRTSGTACLSVDANIVFTNFDVITQNVQLTVIQPLAQPVLGPFMRGSVEGTITDIDLDDATVSAPSGGALYTALIDGVAEAAGILLADPFSQNAGGALQTSTVGPVDFGIPVLIPASQDADISIGIILDLSVTAMDNSSFTAIFEVCEQVVQVENGTWGKIKAIYR